MTIYSATYSPDDNKIRLYATSRLDPETYARVKAAGYKWAPKQDLFFAPAWSPSREDLALELAGEIGDEDTSLADRAEQRAERFEGYQENRTADAEAARQAVHRIADGIPMGQPILVGHHSERHARRDAEKIESGMRRAVKMWETAEYWRDRAAGAIAHAKYKELPDVRARRIAVLEADQRKHERGREGDTVILKRWQDIPGSLKKKDPEAQPVTLAEAVEFLLNRVSGNYDLAKEYRDGKVSAEDVQRRALAAAAGAIEWHERWLKHIENRLSYERAMLAESGYTPPPKPKTSASLPLLNYSGDAAYRNLYSRGEIARGVAVGITKADFAEINGDYKGTRVSECGTHRIRIAMTRCLPREKRGANVDYGLSIIYLTDSKQHPRPGTAEIEAQAEVQRAQEDAIMSARAATMQPPREPAPPGPQADAFAQIKDALKAGVQVVSAPQLFPTPIELARRMVELAEIEQGQRVLEPSAGTGRLLWPILRELGASGQVVAVEVRFSLAEGLRAEHRRLVNCIRLNADDLDVRCSDFLSCNGDLGKFDRIIMNPPFINGADIEHIAHALTFLNPGGRLVALCANGPRQQAKLQPLATSWEQLPAGSFKEAGTGVNVVLLTIEKAEL